MYLIMKEKGPSSSSEYIKYKRQLANTQLVLSDKIQNVPAYERKSIVSRSPIVDALSNSYISRFSRRSRREFISSFGTISILHGKNVVYSSYTGITGAAAPVVFNNAILFIAKAGTPARSVIVHVPFNGSPATLAYDILDSTESLQGMTVYNNQIYVSSLPNVIRRATLNPDTNTITMSAFATISGTINLRAITFDSVGNMYAQNIGPAAPRVSKIRQNGSVEPDWNTSIGNAQPTQSTCLVVNSVEYLYIGESVGPSSVKRIRLDNPSSVQVVAGGVAGAFPGDNVNPVGVSIGTTRAVSSDSYGNVYMSSDEHNRHFMIDVETGLMRTIMGNGGDNDSVVGDIPGTSADTGDSRGFAIDETGKNVYLLSGNGVIRAMPYFVDTKDSGIYI